MATSDQTRKAAVIWMHGLGANSDDMRSLSMALPKSTIHFEHFFLDAPVRPVTINGGYAMPAWYDIRGFNFSDREDVDGIMASVQQIEATIDDILTQEYAPHEIFLAGFSQGAAMALFSALSQSRKLGGIVCLSGYLLLQNTLKAILPKTTPIFMAYGSYDEVVLPQWSKASAVYLQDLGYVGIQMREYPMGHAVCQQELLDLGRWFEEHV